MRAVIQAAIGKVLRVIEELIVELSAVTTAPSTTSVVVWRRGRHFRAAKDPRNTPWQA
ncbi:MAG TPA: hypothetical protein VLW50_10500 [Streptosporangiaceae bacterium]|nr:hypothetical protein [Streptosporangiaceae bacterium]